MLAIRKHFVLTRQVGAARVHQINARQAILLGDGLRTQVLLHGERVIRATFHRRIVGDDHALDAFNATNPGDHPGSRHVFAVNRMGGQLADFEKRRARIKQAIDALARQQFTPRGVAFLRFDTATLRHLGEQGVQRVDLFEHRRTVGGELR